LAENLSIPDGQISDLNSTDSGKQKVSQTLSFEESSNTKLRCKLFSSFTASSIALLWAHFFASLETFHNSVESLLSFAAKSVLALE